MGGEVKDFYVLINFWLIIVVNSECPTLFSSAVYSIYFLLINFCLFPLLLLLFLEYDLKSVRVTSFSRSLSQIQFLKMTSLTYFSRNIEKRGGWVKKMRSFRPQCWEKNRKKIRRQKRCFTISLYIDKNDFECGILYFLLEITN